MKNLNDQLTDWKEITNKVRELNEGEYLPFAKQLMIRELVKEINSYQTKYNQRYDPINTPNSEK